MTAKSAKILVVDDDTHLLELMVDTLSSIGYRVVGVGGGVEALEKLQEEPFDLVVSDIKMPGMDGIALLKKVRRYYPNMPVLFVTGVSVPEIIGRASPDGFLAKPFRINHIEELIENTLKNKPEPAIHTIKRVLVVDDDDLFRDMLADSLRYNEYIPCAVAGGEAALKEIENGSIDAVITDIRMPGIDGLTLLRRIKEQRPEIPVILITAYSHRDDVAKDNEGHGADGFLEKPFKVESIIEILDNLSSPPLPLPD